MGWYNIKIPCIYGHGYDGNVTSDGWVGGGSNPQAARVCGVCSDSELLGKNYKCTTCEAEKDKMEKALETFNGSESQKEHKQAELDKKRYKFRSQVVN